MTPPRSPADDDHERARHRLGRAVRRLGHAVVGYEAPTEVLEAMADALDRLVAGMPTDARRSRPDPQARYAVAFTPPPDGEVIPSSHGDRPFSGPSSPWGVDLEVRRDGEEAVAVATLDAAHEGAPGRSHGGIVAGVFDDVFGFLLPIHQVAAFTGELTVRYLAPTPLHEPLEFRVRLDRREGRKLVMSGEGTAGELCFARASAVFVSPTALLPPG